jgi:hypothetical protein
MFGCVLRVNTRADFVGLAPAAEEDGAGCVEDYSGGEVWREVWGEVLRER